MATGGTANAKRQTEMSTKADEPERRRPMSTNAAPITELPRFAAGSGPVQAPHHAPLSDFHRSAAEKSSALTAAADPEDSDLDAPTVPGHWAARQAIHDRQRQELIDEILPLFDGVPLPTLEHLQRALSGARPENERI
jgi:hypothetical protein